MLCKSCNYPLWNLPVRSCPECGTPFLPSAFDFVPNSIRFCCPHCRTAYYGTDARGHLVPVAFNCVGCAQPISMDSCVLLPAQGVSDEQTKPEECPWFNPRKRWRLGSWFHIMGRAMVAPQRLMQTLPSNAPMGLFFATLTAVAVMSVSTVLRLVISLAEALMGGGDLSTAYVMMILGDALLQCAVILVGTLVWFPLWIGIAHVILMLTGKTKAGPQQTGKAFCYTTPVILLTAVPCMGLLLWPILFPWWCISAGVALGETQKVGVLRGLIASAALPILSAGTLVLIVYLINV